MKNIVLTLSLCAAIAVAANPVFPSSFTAQLSVVRTAKNATLRGTGVWDVSLEAQKEMYNIKYDSTHSSYDMWYLARYDMEKLYAIDFTTSYKCEERPLDTKMTDVWSWVKDATADGQRTVAGATYDAYSHTMGYLNMTVLVSSTTPNVPVYLIRREPTRDIDVTTRFITFQTTVSQNSTSFNVPSVCKANMKIGPSNMKACVPRVDMQSRAIAWYDAKVPYNQEGTWKDYREDCSGFVSYTWQSGAPGLATFEFHEMGKYINKAELLPGDCMLNAGEHVCFFNGWADAAKTTFHAIEEADTQLGTLNHVIAYPYYYDASSFLPFRYNNACPAA